MNYFRMLLNPSCSLDTYINQTALDPETGIEADDELGNFEPRIRAATGLDSAAALFGGTLPLWKNLILASSTFGYSPSNIFMQSYDWRMSLDALEARDGFFTNLKYTIESAYHQNDRTKVVLACHSLGGVIFTWFTQFITARDSTWMETHVHASVLLGAPLLGAPKALNALLSGDIPDMHVFDSTPLSTIQDIFQESLRDMDIIKGDQHVKNHLTQIMRNVESMIYLLPKGGDGFWSKYTWSSDALEDQTADLSKLLQSPEKMNNVLESEKHCSNLTSAARTMGAVVERTVEVVFGNISHLLQKDQVTLPLMHSRLSHFQFVIFIFPNAFVRSRCFWIAAVNSAT
jgi:phospholipid:diacylglycerol acyltransferase